VTLRALVLGGFLVAGCIKVPTTVKTNFCAQPAAQNHFGSGSAASSCCSGPPHMNRFGSYTGVCHR
jgi:hypothetical protein